MLIKYRTLCFCFLGRLYCFVGFHFLNRGAKIIDSMKKSSTNSDVGTMVYYGV